MSVALVEILVGAIFGNIPGIKEHIEQTAFTTFLATFGSMLLTFLAGAEIDPVSLKRHWKASLSIGIVSFSLPFIRGIHILQVRVGLEPPCSEIAGIALSTTSVAVVYAVMVETGLKLSRHRKLILAACFVTDLGTVLRLADSSRRMGRLLLVFVLVTAVSLLAAPCAS